LVNQNEGKTYLWCKLGFLTYAGSENAKDLISSLQVFLHGVSPDLKFIIGYSPDDFYLFIDEDSFEILKRCLNE